MDLITLAHGAGGKLTAKLIDNLFKKYLGNEYLFQGDDGAVLSLPTSKIVFSTDSFVVSPRIFPGGDIGKLAVYGTVNDLAVMGAKPLFLSLGLILEEGLMIPELERIIQSIAEAAKITGVKIVTGDTKVVEKGKGDQIYINTSGIGVINAPFIPTGRAAKPGDKILVNGFLGDHGAAILACRENITGDFISDCAPLNDLIELILENFPVHTMRDPSRGGLAATLNEIAKQSRVGIELWEESIPIRPQVKTLCGYLGLDAFALANEGKVVVILPSEVATEVLETMKTHPLGQNAAIIGEVKNEPQGIVYLKNAFGGERIIDMPLGENLPRIC
ncbi:hydrogenase expression/formation protein HypE [Carboxydothermus pertinax]|uniref:Hydrogenase expression/formation protein HypE n=1 Tax=Carboxydothermus pertinax TaxID=870242 RepID=A0A1L8CY39_9THEO|nr:hydrogenase expression/formation protein HypE [Carboxydothermus pertinax]GAV23779.1 hydrogenase expression/formation protein HypE [Carboxydothermus pertinax]